MGGDGVVATTGGGKAHFEVLDGLRGTAALMVVPFHIQGIILHQSHGGMVFPHAYLAVDFFFALSGFVIAYAYDDRRDVLSPGRFMMLRLVRLHPLVVLGAVFGLASYVLDPFAAGRQNAPAGAIAGTFALALLALPNVPLPGRRSDTHSLDRPAWTLLQEYLGNVCYALILRHMSARALFGLVAVAAMVLAGCAMVEGTLERGFAWEHAWMAPVRLAFPFMAGIWLYRVRDAWPRWRAGYLTLSLALLVVFATPVLPVVNGIALNGIFESLCVIGVFPAIVLAGAQFDEQADMVGVCRVMGWISYPVYITHFPFIFLFRNFHDRFRPEGTDLLVAEWAFFAGIVAIAAASYRWWDVPVRRALGRWMAR